MSFVAFWRVFLVGFSDYNEVRYFPFPCTGGSEAVACLSVIICTRCSRARSQSVYLTCCMSVVIEVIHNVMCGEVCLWFITTVPLHPPSLRFISPPFCSFFILLLSLSFFISLSFQLLFLSLLSFCIIFTSPFSACFSPLSHPFLPIFDYFFSFLLVFLISILLFLSSFFPSFSFSSFLYSFPFSILFLLTLCLPLMPRFFLRHYRCLPLILLSLIFLPSRPFILRVLSFIRLFLSPRLVNPSLSKSKREFHCWLFFLHFWRSDRSKHWLVKRFNTTCSSRSRQCYLLIHQTFFVKEMNEFVIFFAFTRNFFLLTNSSPLIFHYN